MSASPRFHRELTVSPDDIDQLQHVSNLIYLRWVVEIAEAHSSAVGYDFAAYRALGSAFVVRRHEIDYIKPAYAGDRIRLTTYVDSWKQASSVRMTEIVRLADGNSGAGPTLLARASTRWAFVGLDTGRPGRVPPEVREAFATPVSS